MSVQKKQAGVMKGFFMSKSTNQLRIGFIGLGLMGEPMAANLLKAGFPVSVFNRTSAKTKNLKKIGAVVYDSPAGLAEQVDVLITMVTGPEDVQEVLFGKNGAAKTLKQGSIIIDMSTIGPQAARAIAQKLQAQKIEFLDAPVTGSTVRAISGELTIFVGGKKSVFQKAQSVFNAMGKDVLYIGETGQGQAIKLVNNLLVGSTLTALAEGMLLADAQGLSRKKVAQFLANVPTVSAMMKMKLPSMVTGKYKTAFSVANMSKDLELAKQEVKKIKQDVPVLEQAAKLYKQAKEHGMADLDNAAILKWLEK